MEAGPRDEARGQYRQALAEQPEFIDALFGLAELCLAERDWAGVEGIVATLKTIPHAAVDGIVF